MTGENQWLSLREYLYGSPVVLASNAMLGSMEARRLMTNQKNHVQMSNSMNLTLSSISLFSKKTTRHSSNSQNKTLAQKPST